MPDDRSIPNGQGAGDGLKQVATRSRESEVLMPEEGAETPRPGIALEAGQGADDEWKPDLRDPPDSPAGPMVRGYLPFISVGVPVRNEARFIGGTVDQLVGQDYPAERFEVLVVDGCSTDSTREIVAAMATSRTNV